MDKFSAFPITRYFTQTIGRVITYTFYQRNMLSENLTPGEDRTQKSKLQDASQTSQSENYLFFKG